MKTVKDLDWKLTVGMKIKSPKTNYTFEVIHITYDDECITKCIETGTMDKPFLIWLSDFVLIED